MVIGAMSLLVYSAIFYSLKKLVIKKPSPDELPSPSFFCHLLKLELNARMYNIWRQQVSNVVLD